MGVTTGGLLEQGKGAGTVQPGGLALQKSNC